MSDPARIAQTAIQSITKDLSVTANNLANSQTMGFKKSNVDFYELYVQGAGLGVAVNGVHTDYSSGTMVSTGRSTDVAIQDDSFFIVKKDGSGEQNYFSKIGNFDIDKNGNMVTPQGWKVQGFGVDEQTGVVSQIAQSMVIPRNFPNPQPSTSIALEMTLNANTRVGDQVEVTSTVFDSLGFEHRLETTYQKTANNEWQVSYAFPDENIAPQTLATAMTFDVQGNLIGGSPQSFNFDFSGNGSAPGTVAIEFGSTTQTVSEFTLWSNEGDGFATGNLVDIQIDDRGNVFSSYSNGKIINQYKLALGKFASHDGLEQNSGMLYQETLASGSAIYGTAGSNSFGSLSSGMLEGSNVDMGSELIHMVEVERAFEANTKVLQLTKQLDRKILEL